MGGFRVPDEAVARYADVMGALVGVDPVPGRSPRVIVVLEEVELRPRGERAVAVEVQPEYVVADDVVPNVIAGEPTACIDARGVAARYTCDSETVQRDVVGEEEEGPLRGTDNRFRSRPAAARVHSGLCPAERQALVDDDELRVRPRVDRDRVPVVRGRNRGTDRPEAHVDHPVAPDVKMHGTRAARVRNR